MTDHFETDYQPIGSNSELEDEENEDAPPGDNMIHVVPDKNKARWNHIENLDEFFSRVYQFHQRSGFLCMVFQDVLQLVQFAFVVMFSVFLMKCVDYETLFYDRWYNDSHSHDKVHIMDGVYPASVCLDRFDPLLIICILIAAIFWLLRLVKCIYNIFLYLEIRAFYMTALKITADELPNMTWHEVQTRLLEVQTEQQMCIHKTELNELDIYHRILRFKNYMIAMTNKNLLPLKYKIPFTGEYTFLTTGLKYNLEIILFWGPWAPFENYWHLHTDYKNHYKRKELAQSLSQKILFMGIANFVLLPVIMLWQILYSFFRYAEIIKREPGVLGARRWSMFSRLYLRHFNELDHEFNARLNRGYRPAQKYMDLFSSPLLAIIAKNLAFISGSILAVFVLLAIIDEDFLQVQHVITVISVLAAVLAVCRACIPDEHIVWCPEFLLKAVLAQIHYIPDSWKNNAHTYKARDEFSTLYQYKCIYLLEELLSPLITPFILCFSFRHKSLDIVDFYRNFTVEVTGVGDVCSFAQMDIRKHGNPQWAAEEQTDANQQQQAEGGKTEMSLVHFTLTNPTWKPPQQSVNFMNSLRDQVQRDATMMSLHPLDNPLANSLHSLTGIGYNSLYTSTVNQSTVMQQTQGGTMSTSSSRLFSPSGDGGKGQIQPPVRGGVRNAEGPLGGSGGGLLASLTVNNMGELSSPISSQQPNSLATTMTGMMGFSQSFKVDPLGRPIPVITPAGGINRPMITSGMRNTDQETLEYMSTEMSFSALYMHELHRRRLLHPLNPYFDNEEDAHARAMWKSPESPGGVNSQKNPHTAFSNSSSGAANMGLSGSGHMMSSSSTTQGGSSSQDFGYNSPSSSTVPLGYNVPLQQGQFSYNNSNTQGYKYPTTQGTSMPQETAGNQIELQPLCTDHSYSALPQVQGPYGPPGGGPMPNIQEEDDDHYHSVDMSAAEAVDCRQGEDRPLISKDSSIHEL